jgi:hypothetical protein
MAEQQNNGGDPIDRALRRAHGIAGSPLEKTLRLHAYKLIDTGDGTKTDANLDKFVSEQRADPFYASSFTAPPGPAKVAGIDTLHLSEPERAAIASGKVEVEARFGPRDGDGSRDGTAQRGGVGRDHRVGKSQGRLTTCTT